MAFSFIVAVDKNFVIGKNNALPWDIPADLQYFRKTTAGHTVIMGKKTYDSIGHPLPKRRNIVISDDHTLIIPGCEIAHSIDEAREMTKNDGEVFVIGGASIFKQFLPFVDTMYITFIDHEFSGDIYFPLQDFSEWDIASEHVMEPDAENKYRLRFVIYKRKV